MSWQLKREWFALCTVAATCLLAIVFGPSLPEQVPTHFDLQGNVDQYTQRGPFLALMVGLSAGLYLLLTFLPFIDPFRRRLESRYAVLMLIRDFVLGFMLTMFVLTIVSRDEGRIPSNMLGVSLGILFALIGNYLPKIPRNWFFGLRTPWTMMSDTVWLRSHLVGGWMLAVGGMLTVVCSLLGVGLQYVLLPVLVATVVIAGYVYPLLLNRRIQREGKGTTPDHL